MKNYTFKLNDADVTNLLVALDNYNELVANGDAQCSDGDMLNIRDLQTRLEDLLGHSEERCADDDCDCHVFR